MYGTRVGTPSCSLFTTEIVIRLRSAVMFLREARAQEYADLRPRDSLARIKHLICPTLCSYSCAVTRSFIIQETVIFRVVFDLKLHF
jgi:hypothetical protein